MAMKSVAPIAHNNATDAFLVNLSKIVREGERLGSRNGEMLECTMNSFTVRNIRNRYISVAGRRASLPAQIAETMWVLAGRNDVAFLQNYLPKAPDFSDDGKVWRGGYGPRLRNWDGVDQLEAVVDILRHDLDSRRAVMSIFNPSIDLAPGKDIPCNNWLHFIYRDGALHLHVATRSNDIMWGWSGINNFEWSFLLEVVASMVGVDPGSIHYSITSLHLYDHHVDKARKIIDLSGGSLANAIRNSLKTVEPAPALNYGYFDVNDFDELLEHWFNIEERIRTGADDVVNEIKSFCEPLLQSYLKVLYAWWRGDNKTFPELDNTILGEMLANSPAPKVQPVSVADTHTVPDDPKAGDYDNLVDFIKDLHTAKGRAYGNSWKKRGEVLGIMANIARKVDRLGKNGGGDNAFDTAMDLFVYLVKYRMFLEENNRWQPEPNDRSGVIIESLDNVKVCNEPGVWQANSSNDNLVNELIGDYFESSEYNTRSEKKYRAQLEQAIEYFFTLLEDIIIGRQDLQGFGSTEQVMRSLIFCALNLTQLEWNDMKWEQGNAQRAFDGYGKVA